MHPLLHLLYEDLRPEADSRTAALLMVRRCVEHRVVDRTGPQRRDRPVAVDIVLAAVEDVDFAAARMDKAVDSLDIVTSYSISSL